MPQLINNIVPKSLPVHYCKQDIFATIRKRIVFKLQSQANLGCEISHEIHFYHKNARNVRYNLLCTKVQVL